MSELENKINDIVRRSFMFHYRVFGCLEAVFATAKVAISCTLFTNCCTYSLVLKTVADRSQSVNSLFPEPKKTEIRCPDEFRPLPWYVREQFSQVNG